MTRCALATFLLFSALGVGCGGAAEPGVERTGEADLMDRPVVPPVEQADAPPAEESAKLPSRGVLITSTAKGAEGETYVSGTFEGTVDFGGVALSSRGGSDVFVARLEADGAVTWVRAVGGVAKESGPKVAFDGMVKLIATTTGEVDCGSGPLATFDTKMFFMCFFDTEGTTTGGGAFPISG